MDLSKLQKGIVGFSLLLTSNVQSAQVFEEF